MEHVELPQMIEHDAEANRLEVCCAALGNSSSIRSVRFLATVEVL
jgi:hypothetical protein